jgi:hypothetical protein
MLLAISICLLRFSAKALSEKYKKPASLELQVFTLFWFKSRTINCLVESTNLMTQSQYKLLPFC